MQPTTKHREDKTQSSAQKLTIKIECIMCRANRNEFTSYPLPEKENTCNDHQTKAAAT